MSDWRNNPNLAECFENCVAMFRGMPAERRGGQLSEWIAEIKTRRTALKLSKRDLSRAVGVDIGFVSQFETGSVGGEGRYRRISEALDRIEAEHKRGME